MKNRLNDPLIHLEQYIKAQAQRPLIVVALLVAFGGILVRTLLLGLGDSTILLAPHTWHTTLVATALLLGVLLGLTSQTRRKRYAELMHRLPVEATATLRYRVTLAFTIGLPTWTVVSLLWIFGRFPEPWLSSLLISSSTFALGLLTAACLLAPLRELGLDEPQYPLVILAAVMATAAMFIPELSWQFPILIDALLIAASLAICASVWKFSLYLVRLSSLGLSEPPSGKPWWWPGFWYLGALYYLYALFVNNYTTFIVLILVALHFGFNLNFNWIEYKYRDVTRPGSSLVFRVIGNLSLLVFTMGLVITRTVRFWIQDVTPSLQKMETALHFEAASSWIHRTSIGITLLILLYMAFMTVNLMKTFRRRDSLLLRLPILRDDIGKNRLNQWNQQMRWPLVGLVILNLTMFLLTYPVEGAWRRLVAIIVLQLIVLGLGFAFFRVDLPPRARA